MSCYAKDYQAYQTHKKKQNLIQEINSRQDVDILNWVVMEL